MSFSADRLSVEAEPRTPGTVTVHVASEDFASLRSGALQPHRAILSRRVRVEGNPGFLLNHPCGMPI